MQITEEQKRILDSLTCERLSSNPGNLRDVENFCNRRNGSLEHTLKDTAYEEDEANHIAYYLIKDAKGNILFYFSLKCGILYDNLEQGEQLRKLINYYETFLGFHSSNEHGTAIPLYDYACKFMYQEINGIENRREQFYKDFNPDEESM